MRKLLCLACMFCFSLMNGQHRSLTENELHIQDSLHVLKVTERLLNPEKTYAREVVDTLASPYMHGRGYVENGNGIAAEYMQSQFQRWGLKPLPEAKSYFQPFTIPVNTFPEGYVYGTRGMDKFYSVGDITMILANSPPARYTRVNHIVWLDSTVFSNKDSLTSFFSKKYHGDLVVIDPYKVEGKENLQWIEKAKQNPFEAHALLLFNNKKFTWTVATHQAAFPTFEMLVPDSTHMWRRKSIHSFYYQIDSKFISDYPTQNVLGYIKGSQYPDSFLVFSAHYDHLGQIGSGTIGDGAGGADADWYRCYFPGANDNASGCAMLLNLAKYYSQPENKPKHSILFIAFGAEEAGLLGSEYFVNHPLVPLEKIKFLLNMDIMGTGDEGITVVNGSVYKSDFDTLTAINQRNHYLPQVKIRGKAANSDHYYFSEKNVKAFFIYTMGGIKAYHDIYDRRETLPLTKFNDVFRLICDFTHYQDN